MLQTANTIPLEQDKIYHIYNRANGSEKLFLSQQDYLRFIDRLKICLLPCAEFYAYCLLPNHFHFLLRIIATTNNFSRSMSNFSNSYAKYFNLKYGRKGGLFMTPFKRKLIETDASLAWITWYIHRNPLHHGFSNDWQNWQWSSYKAYISKSNTAIQTSYLLNFFGGPDQLIRHHRINQEGCIEKDMQ